MTSSRRDWANEALAFAALKLRRGQISRRRFMQFTAAFGAAAALPDPRRVRPDRQGHAEVPRRRVVLGQLASVQPHRPDRLQDPAQHLLAAWSKCSPTCRWSRASPRAGRRSIRCTWEFKLRQGVTFHNGAPFTAADVKASIELASGFAKSDPVAGDDLQLGRRPKASSSTTTPCS